MTYVKLDAFGRRSWSGKGFYPQLWNSHVLYFCRISPDFSTLKKNKKQTSCPCGSTTKHTSKRNSTYTLRVLQMQQGRYQYSKSQYPFVVYLFWYSVLQRATLYKMHHEQTARTYLLETGISGEEGFCRALLLMLFWLQRSWLQEKKKLSNAVTFLSDHNFHACHFFPSWKKQTAVWRKSVSRSGFEDGGWFAFDKLLSELVQL